MNRRGFLGSLLAAPIAAVMGWKSNFRPTCTGTTVFLDNRPTASGLDLVRKSKEVGWEYYPRTYICHPNHLESMKKIMEQAGKSQARVKAQAAAKLFDGAFQ